MSSFTELLKQKLDEKAKYTDTFSERLYEIAVLLPDGSVELDIIAKKITAELELYNYTQNEIYRVN